jgi:hypothetical protein
MEKGHKLRCVNAKEPGNPLVERQIYTVKQYASSGGKAFGDDPRFDGPIASVYDSPGVEVEELPGNYFLMSRFEPA